MILDETLKDGEMRIYTDLGNGWVEEKETLNVRQYGKTYQMLKEQQKEIEKLNNIINELEKFFKYEFDNEVRPLNDRKISVWTICLDKLKEFKGE